MSKKSTHWILASGALPLASKNVLLVTCMDLRLLDDVVRFMDQGNLTNRYDQFVSAGPSISLRRPPSSEDDPFHAWRNAFYDHLELAVALHEIKYVFVIDHLDCGAHRYASGFDDYGKDVDKDALHHTRIVNELRSDILDYASIKRHDPGLIPAESNSSLKSERDESCHPFRVTHEPDATKPLADVVTRIYQDRHLRFPAPVDWDLKVYGFLMDLRGDVMAVPEFQPSSIKVATKSSKKQKSKTA